jgi:hypothetical protein
LTSPIYESLKVIVAKPLFTVLKEPEIVIVSPGYPLSEDRTIPAAADTDEAESVENNVKTVNKTIRGIRKTDLTFVIILPLIFTRNNPRYIKYSYAVILLLYKYNCQDIMGQFYTKSFALFFLPKEFFI